MSVKLEETIEQLTKNNLALERDIEEKSKIDTFLNKLNWHTNQNCVSIF